MLCKSTLQQSSAPSANPEPHSDCTSSENALMLNNLQNVSISGGTFILHNEATTSHATAQEKQIQDGMPSCISVDFVLFVDLIL